MKLPSLLQMQDNDKLQGKDLAGCKHQITPLWPRNTSCWVLTKLWAYWPTCPYTKRGMRLRTEPDCICETRGERDHPYIRKESEKSTSTFHEATASGRCGPVTRESPYSLLNLTSLGLTGRPQRAGSATHYCQYKTCSVLRTRHHWYSPKLPEGVASEYTERERMWKTVFYPKMSLKIKTLEPRKTSNAKNNSHQNQ